MEYRLVIKSDLNLLVIVSGCWTFGGGSYWSDLDQKDAKSLLDNSPANGINYFDTAEACTDAEIYLHDRGNCGSGHGWAGAIQILWNCKSQKVAVQTPWVSAHNWCIGLTGEKVPGRFKDRTDGEWEGLSQAGLIPVSLYMAQKNQAKK